MKDGVLMWADSNGFLRIVWSLSKSLCTGGCRLYFCFSQWRSWLSAVLGYTFWIIDYFIYGLFNFCFVFLDIAICWNCLSTWSSRTTVPSEVWFLKNCIQSVRMFVFFIPVYRLWSVFLDLNNFSCWSLCPETMKHVKTWNKTQIRDKRNWSWTSFMSHFLLF